MPDALPLTGLFGKVPAHGDFVRRGLPSSFVTPWDAWLQAGMSRARDGFGSRWEAAWDEAPAWRFALPAGACGPDAVAGVMLPSADTVGRRFPITLAALLAPGAAPPGDAWFDAVEGAALAGRAGRADADALAAAIPSPNERAPHAAFPLAAGEVILPPAGIPGAAVAGGEPSADPWGAAGGGPEEPGAAGRDADSVAEVDFLAVFSAGGSAAAPPDDALAGLMADPTEAQESAILEDPLSAWAGVGDPAPSPDTGAAEAPAATPSLDPETATPDPHATAGETTAPLPFWAGTNVPDPLAALIGGGDAGGDSSLPSWPRDDGTDPLAALIGGRDSSKPPQSSWSQDDGPDPLAALMGAAPESRPAEDAPPADHLAAPIIPDDAELFGHAPAAAAPVPAGFATEAPPAPEEGGWWTRGAAHVPPMVWPLHGLPSPDEFAYLLEAEA